MKLYLIRHAIAESRDSQRWPEDSDRPLSKRGVKRFKQAAEGLQTLVPSVDVVLSSPFERAWHTAKMLESAGWPEPLACLELSVDQPGALLQSLQQYAGAQSIALVGHESYLTHVACAMMGWPFSPWGELKRGGVLCIEQAQLGVVSGTKLAAVLPPRVLRGLR